MALGVRSSELVPVVRHLLLQTVLLFADPLGLDLPGEYLM
jgi:hypothetical protein